MEDYQFPLVADGDLAFDANAWMFADETVCQKPKYLLHYLIGGCIGEGSYSKVKEVIDIHTLERKAVKIMSKARLRKIPKGEENARHELRLIPKLRHSNIVRVYEIVMNEAKQKWYTIMEWCCCSLQDLINAAAPNCCPPSQAQHYFRHLLDGLNYLKSQRIAHKDIKPGNLLISIQDVLKITDFGVAEEFDLFSQDDMTKCSQGSPAFQPPEVADSTMYSKFSAFKIDIWSSGVTLYNMLTGQLPFVGDTIYQMLDQISRCNFSMPSWFDRDLCCLIAGMMHRKFETRWSLEQVYCASWVRHTIFARPNDVPLRCDPSKCTLLTFKRFLPADPEQLSVDDEMQPQNHSRPLMFAEMCEGLPNDEIDESLFRRPAGTNRGVTWCEQEAPESLMEEEPDAEVDEVWRPRQVQDHPQALPAVSAAIAAPAAAPFRALPPAPAAQGPPAPPAPPPKKRPHGPKHFCKPS